MPGIKVNTAKRRGYLAGINRAIHLVEQRADDLERYIPFSEPGARLFLAARAEEARKCAELIRIGAGEPA